jgi:HEAT repeat protein
VKRLRDGLASRHAVVVARASAVAADLGIATLANELIAAFDRLVAAGPSADLACLGKTAIVRALDDLGHADTRILLRGVHFVQRDQRRRPPGRDTAGELRAVSAVALLRMGYPDALSEVAELLADPDPGVRLEVARALGATEMELAAPLLRLKALVGDDEPQVVAECLTGVLRVSPSSARPFFERLLDDADPAFAKMVALAAGESRASVAFEILRAWWGRVTLPDMRRTALLAIAMLRSESAIEFLLGIVAQGNGFDARDALAALGLYRDDERTRTRVMAAAAQNDADLHAALREFEERRRP